MTLEEKELEIINHYGVMAQLEYFPTEIYELVEAIDKKEAVAGYVTGYLKNHDEHIIEEVADSEMMLDQFKLKFEYKENNKDIEDNVYIGKTSDVLKYLFKDVGIFIQHVSIHDADAFPYDEANEFINEAIKNIQGKLNFIKKYYIIDQRLIDAIKEQKADRQLERIANEHN